MKHAYAAAHGGMRLRPLAPTDIEQLRLWRNEPANCVFLRKLPPITPAMQRKWFAAYLDDPDELAFAIEENARLHGLIGSVFLYHIKDGEAEFGRLLIGEPRAHGMGAGLNAMRLLLTIGFTDMGLNRIYGHVHPDNIAARKTYARAGMRETGARIGQELEIDMDRDRYFRGNGGAGRDGNELPTEARYLTMQQRGDARGSLLIAETPAEIPFAVRRVFWSTGMAADDVRGMHANRHTAFVLICPQGSCLVRVRDGRGGDELFRLDRPERGLYLPRMLWKEMYGFSPDAMLLCLASEGYDADEYIRDYDAFVKEVADE